MPALGTPASVDRSTYDRSVERLALKRVRETRSVRWFAYSKVIRVRCWFIISELITAEGTRKMSGPFDLTSGVSDSEEDDTPTMLSFNGQLGFYLPGGKKVFLRDMLKANAANVSMILESIPTSKLMDLKEFDLVTLEIEKRAEAGEDHCKAYLKSMKSVLSGKKKSSEPGLSGKKKSSGVVPPRPKKKKSVQAVPPKRRMLNLNCDKHARDMSIYCGGHMTEGNRFHTAGDEFKETLNELRAEEKQKASAVPLATRVVERGLKHFAKFYKEKRHVTTYVSCFVIIRELLLYVHKEFNGFTEKEFASLQGAITDFHSFQYKNLQRNKNPELMKIKITVSMVGK